MKLIALGLICLILIVSDSISFELAKQWNLFQPFDLVRTGIETSMEKAHTFNNIFHIFTISNNTGMGNMNDVRLFIRNIKLNKRLLASAIQGKGFENVYYIIQSGLSTLLPEQLKHLNVTSIDGLIETMIHLSRLLIKDVPKVYGTPVSYTIYNRQHPEGVIILSDMAQMKKAGFKSNVMSVFITHGFLSTAKNKKMMEMIRNYLNATNYNIIAVDWSTIALFPFYVIPAQATIFVGHDITNFIRYIKRNGVSLKNIHLLGHSLGSHVMGNAGRFIYDLEKEKLHRITALDPASPLFKAFGIFRSLSPKDADIVDVIHSCKGGLGIYDKVGTIDFYPNGGDAPQPGCSSAVTSVNLLDACSHGRSIEFYSESIVRKTQYIAQQCDSLIKFRNEKCPAIYAHLGEYLEVDINGSFHLETRDHFPFGLNLNQQRLIHQLQKLRKKYEKVQQIRKHQNAKIKVLVINKLKTSHYKHHKTLITVS